MAAIAYFCGMKLMLDLDIPQSSVRLTYSDQLLLIGSCFTGNVGKALADAKFRVSYNPTGILFDPLSVARHLDDYLQHKQYGPGDLFNYEGLWSSWLHHSDFSATQAEDSLHRINSATSAAAAYMPQVNWVLITLGTAFSYQLVEENQAVANCHKVPANRFNKVMLETRQITQALGATIQRLQQANPGVNIVFTVSPVRHIRDGAVANNRSKARLIEAVHQLTEQYANVLYFPAYELVVDVLRDYRFYDIDLVHPNYMATQIVFERFCETYMEEKTLKLMDQVRKLRLAYHHRPMHPDTEQHRKFLQDALDKTRRLGTELPMLNWEEELSYFSAAHDS